jgi:hypothetical protein
MISPKTNPKITNNTFVPNQTSKKYPPRAGRTAVKPMLVIWETKSNALAVGDRVSSGGLGDRVSVTGGTPKANQNN